MTTVRVTVQGETFTVEVLDPRARPIVALVEGERFEVWPEAAPPPGPPATGAPDRTGEAFAASPSAAPANDGRLLRPAGSAASTPSAAANAAILAPLPGVIATIAIKPGDTVSAGQELLAIEAMKMKNVIRATRPGAISAVRVKVGDTVQHRQVLIEFE